MSAIDPARLAPYNGTSPIMGSAMELGIGQGEEHCRLLVILTGESFATAGPLDSQGKYEFDLQFAMGGTIYQIESASGIFSREADETTSVYQLEPNWLYICLLYLETAE